MNNHVLLVLILLMALACNNAAKQPAGNFEDTESPTVVNGDYVLRKPAAGLKSVLVLFGGYSEKAADINREFEIGELANENGIAVVSMDNNQKLWLREDDKQELAAQLTQIFNENELPLRNTFFGGFSSGGNVALLMADFLAEQKAPIAPKGVFVVDAPVDLAALYKSSEKNVARNFSAPSVQESIWLLDTLGKQFGNPRQHLSNYERYGVYTSQTQHIENLRNLINTKIRFYSEPDTLWWKTNRMADPDQMNAYYLERLAEQLKKSDFAQVEYIPTQNRGYRANGQRHPHSWSIVDKEDLVKWILE